MNRQEASNVLWWASRQHYPGDQMDITEYDIEAFEIAVSAILGPQPDPDIRPEGCWHCRNIEAHRIEYVIAVRTKGGTPMNTPVDCPYHYCPACGRKLEVDDD